MADSTNLDVLYELTQQQLDDTAAQLRKAIHGRDQAKQQLEQLHSYRHDYMDRAQLSLKGGLSASNYRNFVQFLGTLEDAISLQNKVVGQLDGAVAYARENWQHKKRQLDAYDALKARRAQAAQQQEKRREQRLSDERALSRSAMQTSLTAAP